MCTGGGATGEDPHAIARVASLGRPDLMDVCQVARLLCAKVQGSGFRGGAGCRAQVTLPATPLARGRPTVDVGSEAEGVLAV